MLFRSPEAASLEAAAEEEAEEPQAARDRPITAAREAAIILFIFFMVISSQFNLCCCSRFAPAGAAGMDSSLPSPSAKGTDTNGVGGLLHHEVPPFGGRAAMREIQKSLPSY